MQHGKGGGVSDDTSATEVIEQIVRVLDTRVPGWTLERLPNGLWTVTFGDYRILRAVSADTLPGVLRVAMRAVRESAGAGRGGSW